jgi:hypothetical protein
MAAFSGNKSENVFSMVADYTEMRKADFSTPKSQSLSQAKKLGSSLWTHQEKSLG